ncbi:MAG: TetR/AcrR family transcriptional regulator [Solirubrobacteraceae bacterium MAG38_C4-C5]|nr:TetR/AcrR family transcriptional regulator [Candidatus Siliceabacter maunaloa]
MTTQSPDRPLRADARRNHAKVLEAARLVFAQHGIEAGMEEIARHAGVGVGTIYRHFPTKEALIGALAVEHLRHLVARTQEAVGAVDAWSAFEALLWAAAEERERDLAMTEIAAQAFQGGLPEADALHAQLHEVSDTLMGRAVAQGAMRADATAQDLGVLMCGLGQVQSVGRHCPVPMPWQRYLTIVIDGLRAR